MRLTKDYIHSFEALWGEPGQCRIRVYKGEGMPTVFVCTETAENRSGSIVTLVEWLATKVWEQEGEPDSFIWIEHYPASLAPEGVETFHRVTFVKPPNSTRFFSPQWEPMAKEGVESLLGHVIE